MNILLGITGSTGVKAVPKLLEKFKRDGHSVEMIVTRAAMKLMRIMIPRFVENEAQELEHVFHDEEGELFEYEHGNGTIAHINLARWADIAVIAPCTSNTLNKMNIGMCDNLLLSTLKAMESSKRILVAPAMNTVMLEKDIDSFHGMEIAFPTVKKLSCGDFGLGALADIGAIANLVYGHKWHVNDNLWHPGIYNDYRRRNEGLDSDLMTHPGRFGASRKHDVHTGIDLYAEEKSLGVEAFEDGRVASIGWFTGVDAGCDWWYDSQYVAIEGQSGIIVYGEIDPHTSIKPGDDIYSGRYIGDIVRVLKHPPRKHVPGHSMYMLHVELISKPSPEGDYTAGEWELKQDRPRRVLDPTVYLYHRSG